MAVDLKDIGKVKVTEETHAWLTAESMFTRRPMAEIVRDVLHDVVVRDLERGRLVEAQLKAQGIVREAWGKRREDQGIAGRGAAGLRRR